MIYQELFMVPCVQSVFSLDTKDTHILSCTNEPARHELFSLTVQFQNEAPRSNVFCVNNKSNDFM